MAGQETEPGWQGCLACPCRLPGAERCFSPACLAGCSSCPHRRSGGRRQGAGRQQSVLLSSAERNNSGSAAPPPPRRFLAGCAPASSPSERNLLGNGNGNRNCLGSSAKSSGGHGLPQGAAVREGWPCRGGKQHTGWKGLSTPTSGITPPLMPAAHAGAGGDWGQAARYGGTSRHPGVSCRRLDISPWRGQSGLCAASNSSGSAGSFCPTG